MIKNNLFIKNKIDKKFINKQYLKKQTKNLKHIFRDIINEVKNSNKTLNVLSKNFNFNFKIKELQKFKRFKTVVIIGMGGSILAAEAINEFLQKKIKRKFYFLNNLDEKKIINLKKKENFKNVLFLIISKSGNTLETLTNFRKLNIINNNSKNIIIITEKKNNFLYSLSKRFNLFYIEHKDYIGGRYSVFSEVGIVPAYLMGININKFRSNLRVYLEGKLALILKESVIKLASILKENKINNLIFINYLPEIKKTLLWNQQLIAESLGKKRKGFLPVISTAPKDHHSLLQLYLDGPRDKLFYIFSYEDMSYRKKKLKKNLKSKTFIYDNSIKNIKNAQKNALIKVFKKENIPFREFKINKIDEKVLGQIFSYFILETIAIGKLTHINPFNQPAVEKVKDITRKILN